MIKSFKNVLTSEQVDDVFYDYICSSNWSYGHKSGHSRNSPMYWSMNLIDHEFFNTTMVNIIQDLSGDKLEPVKIYAGGNTFGTSGDIHTDSNEDDRRTFLYHASPESWDPMWGGKTIFYPNYPDFSGGEYFEFTPNSGYYFPSKIHHMGEPVTKFFTGLRVCIAFKLRVL